MEQIVKYVALQLFHYVAMSSFSMFTGKTVVAVVQIINGKQSIRHVNCQIVARKGIVRCKMCLTHRKLSIQPVQSCNYHNLNPIELLPQAAMPTTHT